MYSKQLVQYLSRSVTLNPIILLADLPSKVNVARKMIFKQNAKLRFQVKMLRPNIQSFIMFLYFSSTSLWAEVVVRTPPYEGHIGSEVTLNQLKPYQIIARYFDESRLQYAIVLPCPLLSGERWYLHQVWNLMNPGAAAEGRLPPEDIFRCDDDLRFSAWNLSTGTVVPENGCGQTIASRLARSSSLR